MEWYDTRVEGDEVVIAVKKNTGGDARKSELTVATLNGKVYANLSLAQLGTAFSLEASADTIVVDASEAYSTLWVTTNVDEWKAVVTGGADWCELMVDANTATVYTKAYDNTTTSRECTITFTAGSLQKTVRVIQLPDMTLTLNHDTLKMYREKPFTLTLFSTKGGTSLCFMDKAGAWSKVRARFARLQEMIRLNRKS